MSYDGGNLTLRHYSCHCPGVNLPDWTATKLNTARLWGQEVECKHLKKNKAGADRVVDTNATVIT